MWGVRGAHEEPAAGEPAARLAQPGTHRNWQDDARVWMDAPIADGDHNTLAWLLRVVGGQE
eukprot:scaffold9940_cov104-Isochrysis_galbana.AAC.2